MYKHGTLYSISYSSFNVTVEEDKKQSPSTGVMKKKHPYGLNVVVDRGNTIQRTDWWEVLYYIKKLDSADLNNLLPILSSYKIKVRIVNAYHDNVIYWS